MVVFSAPFRTSRPLFSTIFVSRMSRHSEDFKMMVRLHASDRPLNHEAIFLASGPSFFYNRYSSVSTSRQRDALADRSLHEPFHLLHANLLHSTSLSPSQPLCHPLTFRDSHSIPRMFKPISNRIPPYNCYFSFPRSTPCTSVCWTV